MQVVGVSKVKTSGSYITKSGRKQYRGQRRHWYVYFYDDDGKFRKRMINAIEVPYYGSLIRRTKTFLCPNCGRSFRSTKPICPKCGKIAKVASKSSSVGKGSRKPRGSAGPGKWVYSGRFIVETSDLDAQVSQSS